MRIDPAGYRAYLAQVEKVYHETRASERGGGEHQYAKDVILSVSEESAGRSNSPRRRK